MTTLLFLTTFALGLRHGVDWDHLAAIADITGSEFKRRRSAALALLYALGHGAAVLALGAVAILAGEHLPNWVDPVMERLVGATLIALAVFLASSLHRGSASPVSRGMILLHALRRLRARVRKTWRSEVYHDHPHDHAGPHRHSHGRAAEVPAQVVTAHRHRHVHVADMSRYSAGGALLVGVLHGVGAETGTQAVVLVGAAHVASTGASLWVLVAFVLGIVATTGLLALGAALGWTAISRRSRAYTVLTASTAVISLGVGAAYLSGQAGLLPALLG